MRLLLTASSVVLACALAQPAGAQNEERGVPILQAPYHLPILQAPYHLPVFKNEYVTLLNVYAPRSGIPVTTPTRPIACR